MVGNAGRRGELRRPLRERGRNVSVTPIMRRLPVPPPRTRPLKSPRPIVTGDNTGGDTMDTRSLTYAELAAALGITAASAKRLANRHKWPKTIGNDGLSRVAVPADRLTAARRAPDDAPGGDTGDSSGDDTGGVSNDTRALIGHLQTENEELKARIAGLEADLASLRPLAARVAALDASLDGEKRRADELKTDRDRLLDAVLSRPEPAGLFTRIRRALSK